MGAEPMRQQEMPLSALRDELGAFPAKAGKVVLRVAPVGGYANPFQVRTL